MDFVRAMSVSVRGTFALGIHIVEYPRSRMVKMCFESNEVLEYQYEHEFMGLCTLLAEDLNLAVSGGNDFKVAVHNLRTGDVLNVFDLQVRGIRSLLRLGSVLSVGGANGKIKMLDLMSRKEVPTDQIVVEGEITCMSVGRGRSKKSGKKGLFLLVGELNTSNMITVEVPHDIAKNGSGNASL